MTAPDWPAPFTTLAGPRRHAAVIESGTFGTVRGEEVHTAPGVTLAVEVYPENMHAFAGALRGASRMEVTQQ